MTTPTVSDPRARVRALLQQVRVTNLETGKRLDPQASLGRVIADVRGYQHTLVSVDYGDTATRDEICRALDELRQAEAE